jgi:hypothetical protein
MRMRVIVAPIIAALAMIAAGCDPFSGPLPGNPAPSPYFIQHLEGEGSYPLEIDLGSASRNVYLTFANPALSAASGHVTVTGSAAGEEPAVAAAARRAIPSSSGRGRAPTPAHITEFNQDPFSRHGKGAPSLSFFERPPAAPLFDTVGSSDGGTFYNMDLTSVPAMCRKVVEDVSVNGGARTLNIWVADDCWEVGGSNLPLVTQSMVDALAGWFLKAGAFNDIYDWVAGMLGPEWGPHGYSNLIPANNEITILLCNIENNAGPGGYIGYYWSKDNFVKGTNPLYLDYYSSERIMFTVDAVTYATGDDPNPLNWQADDYWPEEIYATLAHEFQHMIHFYQRGVLRDAMVGGDTWINEMASQVVEDLVSDKLGVMGPRGVDGTDYSDGNAVNGNGRLPLFNANNGVSLTRWIDTTDDDLLYCYSITYAFGAWLARNYGGAMLLNRLMQCQLTGPASIENIVSQVTGSVESFDRLLQRWSVAQLLSNVTDAPGGYRYNTGTYVESTVNGNAYRLGSINLYKYSPTPYLYSRPTVGLYQPLASSQALCQAAIPGTGVLDWTLDMPDGVIASVLVRP